MQEAYLGGVIWEAYLSCPPGRGLGYQCPWVGWGPLGGGAVVLLKVEPLKSQVLPLQVQWELQQSEDNGKNPAPSWGPPDTVKKGASRSGWPLYFLFVPSP